MRYRVYPYKQGSAGARSLSRALNGLVLRREGSRFIPRATDTIINWGSGNATGRLLETPMINSIGAVSIAGNKLRFFQRMQQENPSLIPLWWTRAEEIPDDAFPIVCRTVLNGHSGEGIVIAATRAELVPAPLYVKYVHKRQEYRVHVGNGDVISLQRKARNRGVADENVNWQVRNHSNGFVFVRQNVEAPDGAEAAAIETVRNIGLDFGAVDVVYYDNNREGQGIKVLEVNTAPGLEGQTVNDYAQFFLGVR